MNHIYRTLFNRRLGIFQVAAENARSHSKSGRSSGSRVTGVAGALLLAFGAVQHSWAADLPTGGNIAHGNAAISANGRQMQINQASDKLIVNWQSFDIGKDASVTFAQPSASSVALNRVLGRDGSQILGRLDANGRVFLVNPNGILFGKDAQVSTAGLVASTLNIRDEDFLNGNYRFTGEGGSVINQGNIAVTDGGVVALLGGSVSNEGVIHARLGSVALAAGKTITLDFAGDGLLSVEINEGVKNALVANGQLIEADGGQVILTARAAEALLQNVVNNSGVIQARSLEQRNGKIVLEGGETGQVSVAGTLDSSSDNVSGGAIQITGEAITLAAANLDVSGATGGGSIEIGGGYQGGGDLPHAQNTTVDATSTLTADATSQGDGGSIIVWSDGATTALGNFSAKGGEEGGNGGLVETSGKTVALEGITVDTRAEKGETGTWLIDPENFVVGSDSDSNMSGVTLTKNLATSNQEIRATDNVIINDTVSWNANTLTLTAGKNVQVNNTLTATGTAGLEVNHGADNDADGVPYGLYTTLLGRIEFSGGGGLKINGEAYTVINNAADLYAMTDSTGNFALGSPIPNSSPITASIGNFNGKFNGLGNSVFYANQSASGFFTTLGSSAVVSNFKISNSNLVNGDAQNGSVGRFANINYGTILNSSANGLVTVTNGGSVGGFVGTNYGLIAGSKVETATTIGQKIVGGFVGTNAEGGRIIDSYVSASSTYYVQSDSADAQYIGGFVGENAGTITRSYSDIWLKLGTAALENATSGGFVGHNTDTGIIDQAYSIHTAKGPVYASINGEQTGGFVGDNAGTISNAYVYDTVNAGQPGDSAQSQWKGGFAYRNSGTIRTSYAEYNEIYSADTVARHGFVWENTGTLEDVYWSYANLWIVKDGKNTRVSSADVKSDPPAGITVTEDEATLLTSAEAKQLANYTGFDSSIWGSSASGHPILKNIPITLRNMSPGGYAYGTNIVSGHITVTGLQRGDDLTSLGFNPVNNLDVGAYSILPWLNLNANSYTNISGIFKVIPKTLTIVGVVEDKTYDGTTEATLKTTLPAKGGLTGLVGDETLNIEYESAEFTTKSVGTSKAVNLTYTVSDGENGGKLSNYTIATTTNAKINKRPLTEEDFEFIAENKAYDGTTTAETSLDFIDPVALKDFNDGRLSTSYNAQFADKDAGSGIAVNLSGLALAGADRSNYSYPTTLATTADITPRVVQLSGSKKADSDVVIDATQLVIENRVDGDDLQLAGTATLAGSDIGNWQLTDLNNLTLSGDQSGNYTLAGSTGFASINTPTLLDIANVISGDASLSQAGTTTTVTQTSDKAIINWQNLSVASGDTLEFIQPSASSITLNRVIGNAQSIIDGTLKANGRVFILNPNGVLFGANAQINVAALVASIHSLTDVDFLDDDDYLFVASGGDGSVVNEGDIVIAPGGFLALAGGKGVTQSGTVTAEGGKVVLAAADQLRLTLTPADSADSALVDYALSGLAGTLTVNGVVDVSRTGENGGLIETAGQTLAVDEKQLNTGTFGTRSWSLPNITLGEGIFNATFVEENLAERHVALNAPDGKLTVAEDVNWSEDTTLTLGAGEVIDINARITASGENAGLVLTAGEDYHINRKRLALDSPDSPPTGYAGAGITLSGGNATLVINGDSYELLHDMADVEGINTDGGAGYYALAEDVGAGAKTYDAAVITELSGTLAGLGNTISNLSIDAEGSYVGLIGTARTGSVIRDIGLENVNVKGHRVVGALLGYGEGSVLVDNAWASGEVIGFSIGYEPSTWIGGLVGTLQGEGGGGLIRNSDADVKVSTASAYGTSNSQLVGGLVGKVHHGDIEGSYATGAVEGHSHTGGLVGEIYGGNISSSWASGAVTGLLANNTSNPNEANPASTLGGLVGYATGSSGTNVIQNVWATGNVRGGDGLGGLIGSNDYTVINAWASGDVWAYTQAEGCWFNQNVGGLIGGNGGDIINAYATGNVTADAETDNVGGLIGLNYGNISNSHATGDVAGGGTVGNLVGLNNGGNISDSYATGSRNSRGRDIEGVLVAGNSSGYGVGTITNSWYGDPNSGGAQNPGGNNGGNTGNTGNTGNSENTGNQGGDTSGNATPGENTPPATSTRVASANPAINATRQSASPSTHTASDAESSHSASTLSLLTTRENMATTANFSSNIQRIEVDGVTYELDAGTNASQFCDNKEGDCPKTQGATP